MSQLSSGGRKNRNKQTKSYKELIYFLAMFTAICITITIIAIVITLAFRNMEKSKISNSNIQQNNTVSLYKKYITNGIALNDKHEAEGNIIQTFDDGDSIYQYEINYQEISGLKNVKLQDKINSEIKDAISNVKTILENNPEYNRITISAYVSGNFSDVLSVSIDYSLIGEDSIDMKTSSIGLNYRLDTGEKLVFNDMFFENTSIKRILSASAYESLARYHAYNSNFDFGMDLEGTDYGYIEDETLRIMLEYNKNPDVDFHFSSTNIYAIINEVQIQIEMEKYYEDIAVYTEFIANNLYANKDLQKEFYAFTDYYLTNCFEIENTRGNNFYYEVLTYEVDKSINSKIANKAREVIDEKLERYYKVAEENPNKAYMVSVIYFYDTSENASDPYFQYDGYVAEMDIDYYKENKDKIISSARKQMLGEVWCYDFSMVDDRVEFYEQFSAYVNDYRVNDYQEDILTKEDRKAKELENEV